MFLIPALILAATVYFLLLAGRSGLTVRTPTPVDQAIEIVRDRFARGEIDAAEYHRLVTGLTASE